MKKFQNENLREKFRGKYGLGKDKAEVSESKLAYDRAIELLGKRSWEDMSSDGGSDDEDSDGVDPNSSSVKN